MEDGARDGAAQDRLDGQTKLALVAMALAVFLIANDFTSLAVALPHIEDDLSVDVSTAQWVLNAYTLVFGVLIVTGGRIADLIGRRRAFFIGSGIFGTFSAVAAISPDAQVLIGSRAAMAVGAALVWPAVIGLTFAIMPADRASLAGALILGVSGLGNAFGPLIGGALTDGLSWRWILVLNIPFVLIAILAVRRSVPAEQGAGGDRRLDRAGVAALSLALVTFLLALDQASDWGWGDPRIIVLLAVSALSFVALAITQRSDEETNLFPRDVLSNETFAWACVATALASGTFFAVLLFIPQFMQEILGFTAFQSGLGLLPLMIAFSLTAFAAGPLFTKVGARVLLLGGALAIPVGGFLLTLADAGSGYGDLVPGLIVMGIGVGAFYPTLTTVAITSLDEARSSLGGGILYMCQLVSGAVGLGLATAIYATEVHDPTGMVATAKTTVADAIHSGLRADAAIGLTAVIAAAFVVSKSTAAKKA